jgi:hypothetical protein
VGYSFGYTVRRNDECFIEMDVALCDAAGRVTKEPSEREFGESEFTADAGERVPEGMERNFRKAGFSHEPLHDTGRSNKVRFTYIRREYKQ